MTFQSTVNFDQGFGIPGEIRLDSPHRANPLTVNSGDPANNVYGRAFSYVSEGVAEAGGTGVFAGFLVAPKTAASRGTAAGGTLAPTLVLANQEQGEFLVEGDIVVDMSTSFNIGDKVIFAEATGILSAIAPAAAIPAGSRAANAEVIRYEGAAPGLCLIHVDKVPPISA